MRTILNKELLRYFKNLFRDVLDFDRMLDGNRLRVRALFSVINEQNKLSANNNVVVADFSRARALAA